MSAGAAIWERLEGHTAIAGRVYPLLLPQGPTYPAITYQQISAVPMHAMGQDGPLVRVRVQINCWGKTYAEVRGLAAEVERLLSRFRGQAGGVEVQDILLENELDLYEMESDTRRVMQDYSLYLAK